VAKGLSAAFEELGYRLANPQNHWSAIRDDGSGVAVTVWSDEITKGPEPWVLDMRNHVRLSIWIHKVGNSVRKKHLAYAEKELDGKVDLILCVAHDPRGEPRKVKIARPWKERTGHLVPGTLNDTTGEFLLELRPR
jgi:hypothetical protein